MSNKTEAIGTIRIKSFSAVSITSVVDSFFINLNKYFSYTKNKQEKQEESAGSGNQKIKKFFPHELVKGLLSFPVEIFRLFVSLIDKIHTFVYNGIVKFEHKFCFNTSEGRQSR